MSEQQTEPSIFCRLVTHFGDQGKTCNALSVGQSTVSGWVNGTHGMSPKIALRAERKTAGAFKAIDLCPDLAVELS